MLKARHGLLTAFLLMPVLIAGEGGAQNVPNSSLNTTNAVNAITQARTAGGQIVLAGAGAWRYWVIVASAIAIVAFLGAAAFGHWKAAWAGKIVGALLGMALVSTIILILTGVSFTIS